MTGGAPVHRILLVVADTGRWKQATGMAVSLATAHRACLTVVAIEPALMRCLHGPAALGGSRLPPLPAAGVLGQELVRQVLDLVPASTPVTSVTEPSCSRRAVLRRIEAIAPDVVVFGCHGDSWVVSRMFGTLGARDVARLCDGRAQAHGRPLFVRAA